jgi:hypothetical protein
MYFLLKLWKNFGPLYRPMIRNSRLREHACAVGQSTSQDSTLQTHVQVKIQNSMSISHLFVCSYVETTWATYKNAEIVVLENMVFGIRSPP